MCSCGSKENIRDYAMNFESSPTLECEHSLLRVLSLSCVLFLSLIRNILLTKLARNGIITLFQSRQRSLFKYRGGSLPWHAKLIHETEKQKPKMPAYPRTNSAFFILHVHCKTAYEIYEYSPPFFRFKEDNFPLRFSRLPCARVTFKNLRS